MRESEIEQKNVPSGGTKYQANEKLLPRPDWPTSACARALMEAACCQEEDGYCFSALVCVHDYDRRRAIVVDELVKL